MRIATLVVALMATTMAAAQTTTMNIEFGGTKTGTNIYEKKPDGTFVSTTDFLIGTMKFHSVISGKWDGAKIVEYKVSQETPQGKGTFEVANGKVKVTNGDKVVERDFKIEPDRYMGNLHPQFNVTLLRSADYSKKEPQKFDALLLDSGGKLSPGIKPLKERTSKSGVAKMYEVQMPGVTAECGVSEQGIVTSMDVPSQKLRFVTVGWESLFVDPLAAYPELSQPTHKVTVETGVKMKTRDGVELVADVIRPTEPGKYPVILTRTPYGRAAASIDGNMYASRGYVYVSQDCRGRGDSTGDWDPFVNERKDGYDAVDWASKQPWSNGKVGMIGASYGGLVQWAAAVENHPALKCLVPQVSPPDAMLNIPYDFGVFFLYGNIWWGKIVRDKNADMSGVYATLPHPDKFGTLPLSKVDDAVLGYNVPFYDKWLEREGMPQWKGFDWVSDLRKTNIPALHISGWWDGDEIGTMTNWSALRNAKKANQYLIYGPWTHAFNTTSKLGDVDYGPTAILELDSVYIRWFDTWLKDKQVSQEKTPKVKAFVTGANKWVEMEDWPSSKYAEKTLFLSANAPANGKASKGELVDKPAESQEPTRYIYNPARTEIPKELLEVDPDKATTVVEVEDDEDGTLVYKTAVLTKPMAIAGPIELSLRFQTSARDTDFYATLVDIDEKGVMRQICRAGKMRAAYLGGFDKPRPVTPGKTYTAKITLWDTAHELKAGHRLGLMITSSMFPIYARNLGTGEPIKDATRMVVQSNAIFHDKKNPSTLKFRVLW